MRYEETSEAPVYEAAESDIPTDAVWSLITQAGESRRVIAERMLEPELGPLAWNRFEFALSTHVEHHRHLPIETLYPMLLALAEATVAALPNKAIREQYRQAFSAIEEDAQQWCTLTHIRHVARFVHTAMLWDAVVYLASTGMGAQRIASIVTCGALSNLRLPEPARTPPRGEAPQRSQDPTGEAAQGFRAAARRILDSVMAALEREGARRAKQIARRPDVIAMKETAERIRAELERSSVDATRPIVGINGQDLRGSIVGTCVCLVAFSWLSLSWSALISAPFGFGLAIFGTAVALWGGFGMGAARDSTLKTVGFEPAAADSELARSTTHLARCLDIPVPTVGVFPDANAFAMGQDIDDATLAIGKPLLDRLTSAQLDAVIGHELGHIVSGDMRRMMLMRTFQGAMVWFACFQGLKQVARWVIFWGAEFYITAFSRRREYWADAIGAVLTSKEAMIGALRVLDGLPPPTGEVKVQARFMFHSPFASHPSTAARIDALEQETYIRKLPLIRG